MEEALALYVGQGFAQTGQPRKDRIDLAAERVDQRVIVKARLALTTEVDGGEAANADGDAVRQGISGAAFQCMAKAVPEVEEQALGAIELVDFDEPFLRRQAMRDQRPGIRRGIRVELEIPPEGFFTMRKADFRSLRAPGGDGGRADR